MASVWLACQAPSAPTTMTLDHLHPSLAQTVESMADDTVDIAQARQSSSTTWPFGWPTCCRFGPRGLDVHLHAQQPTKPFGAGLGAGGRRSFGCKACARSAEAQKPPRATHARWRPCVGGIPSGGADTVHGATNPTYDVSMGKDVPGMACFSKTYTDEANPQQGFGAVMTCSSADRGCPLVTGRRPFCHAVRGPQGERRDGRGGRDVRRAMPSDWHRDAVLDGRGQATNWIQRNQRVNAVRKAKPAQAHA